MSYVPLTSIEVRDGASQGGVAPFSFKNPLCPFINKNFDEYIPHRLTSGKQVVYVIARLWNASGTATDADAQGVHNQITFLQKQQIRTLTLPRTISKINRIQYFTTRSTKDPFQFMPLWNTDIASSLKIDPFMEDYLYCARHSEMTPTLLQRRHGIIEDLGIEYYSSQRNYKEFYFWLDRTAREFPNDRKTHAILDNLFRQQPPSNEEAMALRDRICELKREDKREACCRTIGNIFKSGIGYVVTHFLPTSNRPYIAAAYLLANFGLLLQSNGPTSKPYRIAHGINNIFLAAFATESIEAIMAIATSGSVRGIDIVNIVCGSFPVIANLTCPRFGPRFENITRCWRMLSGSLYVPQTT